MIDQLSDRAPVFLANNGSEYYDLDSPPQATLNARGPVFNLQLGAD